MTAVTLGGTAKTSEQARGVGLMTETVVLKMENAADRYRAAVETADDAIRWLTLDARVK